MTVATTTGNRTREDLPRYVLVTPARNEARFIEATLRSVTTQTALPQRWVIVSDGSTDGTDEIVERYAARHPWIELLRVDGRNRNFAGKVAAFDAGGPFQPESNYLFGEGGAGTFSDGKVSCRGTGPDVLRVLEVLAECKGQQPGKPSILYYHRPHLGSNRLPAVVKALRRKIEEMGGEVRFKS